jgi:glutamate-1-semialdehyde 2,1-aminomutase
MKEWKSSQRFMERAMKVLPGGVNSPVRSFRSVGGRPFVAVRGEGPSIFDLDGNSYIDLVGSWGPLILGHRDERVLQAIESALKNGFSFGITSEPEVLLAEKICSAVPSMEMLRLVSSGTEACMSVIRLARAFTKRRLILKFDGHYHGHADSFLIAAGSGLATLGLEDLKNQHLETIVIPFNDVEALQACFQKYGELLAGVILEVVTGNMGVVLPDPHFLKELRHLCSKSGSLLIFDEVMTGFRLSWRGAQGIYSIDPDLSCFGKIIGGGMPVGAYGGRRDIMSHIAPLGSVYQAGTLSGNPVACTAGLRTLEIIEAEGNLFYQKLDSMTAQWASELKAHIHHRSLPVSIVQMGSMLSIFFRQKPPRNFQEAKESDIDRFNKFFWALIDRGVYFPPSAFESCFVSIVHDQVLEPLVEASLSALDEVFSS